MSDDSFTNLGPAWINNLRCDIEEKAALPEDVELLMKFYCHLYESDKDIPLDVLRPFLLLINQAFKEYLDRKANGKSDGALEAAFGLTGIQGTRKTGQRDENIATDIARYYLRGKSLEFSKTKAGTKYKLGRTTIHEAWKFYGMTGIFNVRHELINAGKDFTKGQWQRALKIENQYNKIFNRHVKNTER
jgi:hypothetical protein